MDLITALILGVVEGITEFLPISSTGHLIILNKWFSFGPEFTPIFDIVIQMGAISAVFIYFRRKLLPQKREWKRSITMWKKILIALVPTLIFGALFANIVEEKLFNPITVAIALIIGGIIILIVEKRPQAISSVSSSGLESISYKKAFFIGLIQCIALVPGTSRSGATIIGAMSLGVSRVQASEFSFFLAIPTIASASVYKLLKAGFVFTNMEVFLLILGLVASFVTAWVVVSTFMKFIHTKDFKPFGYYRIVLGILLLIFFI